MKKRMNENEVKIRLRDKLAKAELSASTLPSWATAFYDGKATAFAEAIEVIEELEATQ